MRVDGTGVYKIYRLTNTVNNMVYIGMTSQPIRKRWNNGNGYLPKSRMGRAIAEFGWGAFVGDVLEDGLTEEEADEREKYYIALFKSSDPEYGYNVSIGGVKPALGIHHDAETRKKISENSAKYWLGKSLPDDMRTKISEANTGRTPWNFGKHFDDKAKKHISEGMKRAWKEDITRHPRWGKFGADNPMSVKILCVETGEVFDGVRDAARKLSIPSPNISRALASGGKNSAGKVDGKRRHWRYAS